MESQTFINKVLKELGLRMENPNKVVRAVFGSTSKEGLVGGVGEEASAEVILAKYDELNGYITKNGIKVKNRAFFDKKTKLPVKKPEIVFIVKVNGSFKEVSEKDAPEINKEKMEMEIAFKEEQDAAEVRRVRGRPKKEEQDKDVI